jgi:hypothetical protein
MIWTRNGMKMAHFRKFQQLKLSGRFTAIQDYGCSFGPYGPWAEMANNEIPDDIEEEETDELR